MAFKSKQIRLTEQEIRRLYEAEMRGEKPLIRESGIRLQPSPPARPLPNARS